MFLLGFMWRFRSELLLFVFVCEVTAKSCFEQILFAPRVKIFKELQRSSLHTLHLVRNF